jgi:hypothetical protein
MFSRVPDAIPISFSSYLKNFFNLFSFNNSKINSKTCVNDNYTRINGYSCRTLFEILCNSLNTEKNFAITPIHHTSWRNIIQKYINNDNISIIELNDKMNNLEDKDYSNIDFIIISHLFGQDFDMEYIAKQKEKYNFIIIEDRVQGGSLDKPFSHECVDLSFYSMGIDKRPCSLGGGFVNIKNKHNELISDLIDFELKPESNFERFKNLIKKFPTILIYNYSWFYKIIFYLSYYIFNNNLVDSIKYYRKKNPGFEHDDYMKEPSNALNLSMFQNKNNYIEIEKNMIDKYTRFFNMITIDKKENNFMWMKNSKPLTLYNNIYINNNELINRFNKDNIPYVQNPTWKTLDLSNEKYNEFINNMYYLPCLYNMKYEEIILLGLYISDFI